MAKAKFPSLDIADDASVLPDLDPRLQEIIGRMKEGAGLDETLVSSTEDGRTVVDVLARLDDASVDVPGLNKIATAGAIVTGTVDVQDIERVRTHPNVKSLKAALTVTPALSFSVSEIEAAQSDIAAVVPAGSPAIDGRGVIVGIVDFGCDFMHNNFRNADGTTRLLALWDQRGGATSASPAPYNYGREISRAQLNAALTRPSPYVHVAYQPDQEAHGTHVMDIAAGNGRATGNPGVASGADLLFVHLAANDFTVDQAFGNSRRLAEAVDYIFRKAATLGRPAVVNLSLGTNGGPHDGTTHAEAFFDAMLATPGRAIVIAAGNSRQHGSHATNTVAAGSTRSLRWQVSTGDATANEMEIWYANTTSLALTLVTPSGQRIGPLSPGDPVKVLSAGGATVGRIIYRANDPNNDCHQANVILEPTLPAGTWTVELRNTGAAGVPIHAWIERDDFGRSRFAPADTATSHTLGSISCGAESIVVGSYNPAVPAKDISPFSAEGPTRLGAQKPEISAPGHRVVAARSRTQGSVAMPGTSMAAPHVAGVVALMLQAGGLTLTNAAIRDTLTRTARKFGSMGSWSPLYGSGGVAGAAAVRELLPAETAVAAQTVSAGAEVPALVAGNGMQHIGSFVDALLARTRDARIKLRVEVELEPVGIHASAQVSATR